MAIAGAVAVIATSSGSCKSATYVTVEVSTDVKCDDLKGVSISVAAEGEDLEAKAPSTSSTFCDATGRVGALTISPESAKDGQIGVRVVAGFGKPVDQCPPYDKGCIVARRVLRYSPHEALSVGVKLYADCAGIPCGARSTCVAGKGCVPAEIADTSLCTGEKGCGDEVLGGAVAPPPPGSEANAKYIDFFADPGAIVCGTYAPTPATFDFDGHTYMTVGWDAYNEAKGYGWSGEAVGVASRALAGYDDNNGANILQRSYLYDDFGHRAKFEIVVANGHYDVTVGLGRPCKEYPNDPMNLWLEGQKVIDEALPNKVSERTFPVDVADGRLTLEMGEDSPSKPGSFTFVSYLNIVPR